MFPLIPGKKNPLRKGWQDAATTDPMAISMWFRETPGINYGIRTGLANNIVVIDLDGPEARAWWEATGIGNSTAVVYSPRKDGGEHHYFRIYDVEIGNSQGRIGPGVDVRGEGGLAVGPGSRTPDGVYHGDLSNIPDAPQALLDLLPEKQAYQRLDSEAYDSLMAQEKVTEPTDSELDDIRHIETSLLALPRKWSEGDGWHDTVFRACCWLWRMVRTPSYAITEHQAVELMLSSTPVWPEDGWGEDEVLKQWDSARESTRGEVADPPFEELHEPLDAFDIINRLPQLAPRSQQVFFDLLGGESTRTDGLIDECLYSGLDDHETVSVIYASKAGEQLRSEWGYRKLWRDVAKRRAIKERDEARERGIVPLSELAQHAEPKRPRQVKSGSHRIALMSDAERKMAESVEWWGTEYLTWTKEIVPVWNGPYHRMNRWTILSLIFSQYAAIPLGAGLMFLNLFLFVLGKSTTGKSESLKIMNSVLRSFFHEDDDPDIGGDPSPSALSAVLIERDGKPSLFHNDEADGQIAKMKQEKGYQVGLIKQLTELYEGEVPKMLRTMSKDVSNRRATSMFSIHFMGTFDGITDVLEPEDWMSGFLPRFIWAIGEESERTRDSLYWKFRKPGAPGERDPKLMQKQWAAQFRSTINRISPSGEMTELEVDDAVHERLVTMKERMYEIAGELREMRERIEPTVGRMANSILKAACLVALAQGRRRVEMKDALVAMLDAEEWFGNAIYMVTATDASKFTRRVAAIETMALERGGEILMEQVYRLAPGSKSEVDKLVAQLLAEGRAELKQLGSNGKTVLRTLGEV